MAIKVYDAIYSIEYNDFHILINWPEHFINEQFDPEGLSLAKEKVIDLISKPYRSIELFSYEESRITEH